MTQSFRQALGLPSAIAIVMGSMVGSGVFIVAADIARLVDSPSLFILVWLITGFLTVVGALCYGELAAMMPKAGGQYVFLREALGPLWGFLYGWTLFLVIQTGTIAAVCVAFGKFLGVLFPVISDKNWILHIADLGGVQMGIHTQNAVAITIIALLTAFNIRGVQVGAAIQNIFTTTKILALAALIVLGLTLGSNTGAIQANFGDFWRKFSLSEFFPVGDGKMVGLLSILAIAQVGSLFSADAWNNVTFTAAEVKNPSRNLPIALGVGTGSVILLYVLANLAYLTSLPLSAIQTAPSDRVATAVLHSVFGNSGAVWMAIAILISTFGCANGMVLAGARVYYAMSKDGLFFQGAGQIHEKFQTPAKALVFQCVWTAILCLSGTYGQLLDYVIFAVLIFYILTIAGLFVLRAKRPDEKRPYRAIGYPWLPASYIIVALFIDICLLLYKPQYTWPGLFIVLSGVPVYWFWRKAA